MRHCVFCASKECEYEIGVAKRTMNSLAEQWDVEHDVVLCAYHSEFVWLDGFGNVEICLENDDVHQLIKDCMEWATRKQVLSV